MLLSGRVWGYGDVAIQQGECRHKTCRSPDQGCPQSLSLLAFLFLLMFSSEYGLRLEDGERDGSHGSAKHRGKSNNSGLIWEVGNTYLKKEESTPPKKQVLIVASQGEEDCVSAQLWAPHVTQSASDGVNPGLGCQNTHGAPRTMTGMVCGLDYLDLEMS